MGLTSSEGNGSNLIRPSSPSDGTDRFSATGHADSLLFGIRGLREQKDLCDVTIITDDGQAFHLHRVVLAAGSPYFHAMFTNKHRESFESTVSLGGVDSTTLDLLLNFIYSSSLEIQEDNVQNLLSGASLLQLPKVVDACCLFLRSRISPCNCLGIAAFADLHCCAELFKTSWSFALENFSEVAREENEEFLNLPATLLAELLKSEDLQVHSEEEVLEWVLRWYAHDETVRCEEIMSILRHVKLPLIQWRHVSKELSQFDSLLSHPELQSFLANLKLTHHLNNPPSDGADNLSPTHISTHYYSTQCSPRPSIGRNMFVYAVGGETSPGRTTINSVERFNPAKNSWQCLSAMDISRRGVGVAILNKLLYAIGGSDGLHVLDVAECYDPLTNSWSRVAPMLEKRSSVAAASLGNFLYALGGYDGISRCLQSVERYDPQCNTWSYVASMSVPRSMACACPINNHLLMVGGYSGVTDLQSCEEYNPESDSWSPVASMSTRRCMAGVAVMDGLVYVVGGCDHSVSLRSVEVYTPTTKKWSIVSEMVEGRSGLGVAVVGRKLYAIGGHTGSGRGLFSSAEQYDAQTDTWAPMASMATSRRRFGCCS